MDESETKERPLTGGAKNFGLKEIAIIAGVLIVLIVLFVVFIIPRPEKPETPNANQTPQVPGTVANIEQFTNSLQNASEVAIVENLTDIPENKTYLIYNCAAGLLGSATSLGKNATLYVILGDNCTKNTPPQTVYYNCSGEPPLNATKMNVSGNVLGNDTCLAMFPAKIEELRASECAVEYGDEVYFSLNYGPSLTTFLPKTAYIFIDETFTAQCGFQLKAVNQTNATNSS